MRSSNNGREEASPRLCAIFASLKTAGIATLRKLPSSSLPLVLITPLLTGCWGVASLSEPPRIYTRDQEIRGILALHEDPTILWQQYAEAPLKEGFRNDIIGARMYAIDMAYTDYEAALTHEGQEIDAVLTTAAFGLNTAGPLTVPLRGFR